jgi:low affinity Fe/Cu permease
MATTNAHISRKIENLASSLIKATGSNIALFLAFGIVLFWVAGGLIFHYSEKWKSDISTVSSIITILMVFLIQKSQNKDSLAIQLKLNELVAAHELASNRLVNVEGMTQDELNVIQKYYSKLSDFAKSQDSLTQSHSIDEVHIEHEIKKEMEQELKQLSDDKQDSSG